MARDRCILLVSQKQATVSNPRPGDIHQVGTLCRIKQVGKSPDGTMRVVVEGLQRCGVVDYLQEEPFFVVTAQPFDECGDEPSAETEALMRALVRQYEKYVRLSKRVPPEALVAVSNVSEPGRLADGIAAHLLLKAEDKQEILGTVDLNQRLRKVSEILSRETELLELERRINVRVRKQMEKSQREYYLREQMKAIQSELGEKDERGEAADYRARLREKELPEEVGEKALREVDRLEKMPAMSAEAVVVRTYLDWILALPWLESTTDSLDLDVAERILEEDHYGLEKPKERILEFLAIRQLSDGARGPILCLIGPPGVGKTSLARSVARAMDRKFVRISLGGVRDEAEIRGHRRTYVGALPGRIIQGMRQAGSRNPVFLLDEVDKMSHDFRGDPASALLEVLDPEQNCHFSDHYMELSFDLSDVLFITTANTRHTIPRPLLDRMEAINIPGYTELEKLKIAERYLLPRQVRDNGLDESRIDISHNVIRSIIREYTREAGVRNLERELGSICRKAAREVVQRGRRRVRATRQNLHRFIGPPRFRHGTAEVRDEVGVATGVGWTDTGGDTMPIEVSVVSGKANLMLTGKMGEVMRESAQAGLSFIRARAGRFGVPEQFYQDHDIHVHIPEGAQPKEGPSAGVAITLAMLSALTGRPIRRDVAMTGEITLRGRVLPIGGVKEKVLAAHRAGVSSFILPRDNKKDVDEVPVQVRRKVEFIFVEHMDEVIDVALLPPEQGDEALDRGSGPEGSAELPEGPPLGRELPGISDIPGAQPTVN